MDRSLVVDVMEVAEEAFSAAEECLYHMNQLEESDALDGELSFSTVSEQNISSIHANEIQGVRSSERHGEGQLMAEECDEESAELNGGMRQLHPLLFPDVVRDVLKHLSAKDVETCRLVCRSWNMEASKVLQGKRIVVFVEPDAVRIYNNAMRCTTTFPHAQYEFCLQDFTGLVDENLHEFWNIFGPHIKSLDFRQSHIFWRDFFEIIMEKVPKLEKLSLKYLPRHMVRGRNLSANRQQNLTVKKLQLGSIPATTTDDNERLTDLLKALPNLEEINFLPVKQAALQTKICNALLDVVRKPEVSLTKLKRINLKLELGTDGLEALVAKGFPLRSLNLSLTNGVKATTLKDLFSSVRATVTELSISFPESFSNYKTFVTNNSMLPEESVQLLSNLKSLSMKNFKGSLNFVQKLTKLKELEFTTNNVGNSVPLGFQRKPSALRVPRSMQLDHSLKSLKITSTRAVAETLTLDGISRCFPHLTCLHLHGVDDDGLGVIYRNLPFLSEVELLKAHCTDQGLTGIPLEICNDMVETSTFIVVQAEKYRRDLFIGSLQYLASLSISSMKISDASIALGLVDCKNLKKLTIGSPLITDTGVILITDRFFSNLELLDVSECCDITEQSKFYAGEKLSGKLRVAEPAEQQTQAKPTGLETIPDPNRGIVKSKRLEGPSASFLNSSHSKFITQDTEFFEEHSDDELRERGLALFPHFHNDRHRQRILRIREAMRRNGDFMRALQRLGILRFRRLFRRELQEGWRLRDNQPDGDLERQMFRFRRRNLWDGGVDEAEIVMRDLMEMEMNALLQNRYQAQAPEPPEIARAVDLAVEGPAAADDDDPNRLPEFHMAEILRLGLRLEDVEYWLLNLPLFEREDNLLLEAERGPRGDELADVVGGGDAGMAGAVVGPRRMPDNEDIDLEAFRRVVLNPFADEFADVDSEDDELMPEDIGLPDAN